MALAGCEGTILTLQPGIELPQSTCGDGALSPGEICDGANLGGATCASLGLGTGTLRCESTCTRFDVTQCSGDPPLCGNDLTEANELCDGTDVPSTCEDLGYAGGTLTCSSDCTAFVTDDCLSAGCPQVELASSTGELYTGSTAEGTDTTAGSCGGHGSPELTFRWQAPSEGTFRFMSQGSAPTTVLYVRDGSCEGPELSCDEHPAGGLEIPLAAGQVVVVVLDGPPGAGDAATLAIYEVTCGNDVREASEVCDGADLAGETCTSLGLGSGALACAADCASFDTSSCVIPTGPCCTGHGGLGCDDALVQACVCAVDSFCCTQSWDPGCAAAVEAFQCGTCSTTTCGNGVLEPPHEVCDGADLGSVTCQTLGFTGGTLACFSSCQGFDVSGCTSSTGPVCGDGAAEGLELCDGTDLRGFTCQLLGFSSGTLACDPTCFGFDTSACVPKGTCGDGFIGAGEQCDGANLAGASCSSLNLPPGTLACAADCTFDTSGCVGGSGDCCTSSGVPGCADAAVAACVCQSDAYCCTVEWDSQCVQEVSTLACGTCGPEATCGDGVAEGQEICDGGDLRQVTCNLLGFSGGTLGCAADCSSFDTSACHASSGGDCCTPTDTPGCLDTSIAACVCSVDPFCCLQAWDGVCVNEVEILNCGTCEASEMCGDNVAQGSEACDGSDLRGQTCESLGFPPGTLACAATCESFDTSGCQASNNSCCAASSSPGCDDTAVQSCVCAVDSFCCDTAWDAVCVGAVSSLGCGTCGGSTAPCCTPTPGVAGCFDATIQSCVCAQDSFCCTTEWDSRCVRHVGELGCGDCSGP